MKNSHPEPGDVWITRYAVRVCLGSSKWLHFWLHDNPDPNIITIQSFRDDLSGVDFSKVVNERQYNIYLSQCQEQHPETTKSE